MIFPTYTALATSMLIILLMTLGFRTSLGRSKYDHSIGYGGPEELEMRMRSHGNLAENAAIVLLCLGFLEMSGADRNIVGLLAAWFVVARLLHPLGISERAGAGQLRFIGGVSTYLIGSGAGVWLLWRLIGDLVQ